MAKCRITYWQEIPSMVEATDESETFKVPLSQPFQELIDNAAMKRKLFGTDDYLHQWRKGRPFTREGAAKEVAEAIAAELEARLAEITAEAMAVKAGETAAPGDPSG